MFVLEVNSFFILFFLLHDEFLYRAYLKLAAEVLGHEIPRPILVTTREVILL